MKNALGSLTLATLLLFAISALAADKVVVVPLNSCHDPNLLPANPARQHRVRTLVPPCRDVVFRRGLLQGKNANQTERLLRTAKPLRGTTATRLL